MHISNDRYFRERQRHDLALRMIRHEARTCTIKSCTGLTEDRIRRLCRTYAIHSDALPIRRRGKSPQRIAFFTRNAQLSFESSCLTSVFVAFGLLRKSYDPSAEAASLEYGALFCDAFETHLQLSRTTAITFEHAWFLLQQLNVGRSIQLTRCRQCHGQHLRDTVNTTACPTCRLRRPARSRRAARTPTAALLLARSLAPRHGHQERTSR